MKNVQVWVIFTKFFTFTHDYVVISGNFRFEVDRISGLTNFRSFKISLPTVIDAKIMQSVEKLYTKNKHIVNFYNKPKLSPIKQSINPLFPAALFYSDSDSETGEFIVREDLESASW